MEPKYKPSRSIRNGKKREFLRCLARLGLVRRACEAAGVARQIYYDWRHRDHRFVAETISRGVIVNWTLNAGQVVRLAPPLAIVRSEIDIAVAAMRDALLGTRDGLVRA